jgi:hypothetical protein
MKERFFAAAFLSLLSACASTRDWLNGGKTFARTHL